MFSTNIAQLIFLLSNFFENLLLFYSCFPVCCEAKESRFSKHVDFLNIYERIFLWYRNATGVSRQFYHFNALWHTGNYFPFCLEMRNYIMPEYKDLNCNKYTPSNVDNNCTMFFTWTYCYILVMKFYVSMGITGI